MSEAAICEAHGVSRRFAATVALDRVDYRVDAPGLHAIVGPSGSGKTTLLNVLAGLDAPTEGTVHLAGLELTGASALRRGRHRAACVGFVFQRFNLLTTLTARENVTLLADTRGDTVDGDWIAELADAVNVGALLDRYPLELSGGQQQRVAVVRALAHQPKILFADEPTGSLDTEASAGLHELLADLARRFALVVVLVTHDRTATASCDTVTAMRDGRIEA